MQLYTRTLKWPEHDKQKFILYTRRIAHNIHNEFFSPPVDININNNT